MHSSRILRLGLPAALLLACLGGVAYWRLSAGVANGYVPSAKVTSKLQALRERLSAYAKSRPTGDLTKNQLNAAGLVPANQLAAELPFTVGPNRQLEKEAAQLDGIEIPPDEDARAKGIRDAALTAKSEAQTRYEQIRKYYPFILTTPFNKDELVKKQLREANPELGEIVDWRKALRLVNRFQWDNYQGYINVHDQGGCNQCWAFATLAAYESSLRLAQALGTISLDPSNEPAALESAPLPPGFKLLAPWKIKEDSYQICREMLDTANAKQTECRSVVYSLSAPPPYRADDGAARQMAANIITTRDSCSTAGWHGTAFNYMLTEAKQNRAFREMVAWDYVNYPPSQMPTVEQIKQSLLEHGPLVALVYMDDVFRAYKSGVYEQQDPKNYEVNHAVLLTGWDNERQAWRIQNSFGVEWGEQGFMWIKWNANSIGKYAAWLEVR